MHRIHSKATEHSEFNFMCFIIGFRYESLLSEAASCSSLDDAQIDTLLTKLENFIKEDVRTAPNTKVTLIQRGYFF